MDDRYLCVQLERGNAQGTHRLGAADQLPRRSTLPSNEQVRCAAMTFALLKLCALGAWAFFYGLFTGRDWREGVEPPESSTESEDRER